MAPRRTTLEINTELREPLKRHLAMVNGLRARDRLNTLSLKEYVNDVLARLLESYTYTSYTVDSASVLIDSREKAVDDSANPLASGCG
mgnify:CR=1 FL=1